jgi:hypothetical protein
MGNSIKKILKRKKGWRHGSCIRGTRPWVQTLVSKKKRFGNKITQDHMPSTSFKFSEGAYGRQILPTSWTLTCPMNRTLRYLPLEVSSYCALSSQVINSQNFLAF